VESNHVRTVLLIEEQPDSVRTMLEQVGLSVFQLAQVRSIGAAEEHLARHQVESILLDLAASESNGLEGFSKVQESAPHTAIVLLCEPDDESIAIQGIHQGAQDYLIKGQIEPRELKRALFNAIERKALEEIQLVGRNAHRSLSTVLAMPSFAQTPRAISRS